MDIIGWIVFGILVVLMGVVAARNMNHNYTAGSGMFKKDDNNLEKDEYMDSSDYNYFDDKGNLRK